MTTNNQNMWSLEYEDNYIKPEPIYFMSFLFFIMLFALLIFSLERQKKKHKQDRDILESTYQDVEYQIV